MKKAAVLIFLAALVILIAVGVPYFTESTGYPMPETSDIDELVLGLSGEGEQGEIVLRDAAEIQSICNAISEMRYRETDKQVPDGGQLFTVDFRLHDGSVQSCSYYQCEPSGGFFAQGSAKYKARGLDMYELWKTLA